MFQIPVKEGIKEGMSGFYLIKFPLAGLEYQKGRRAEAAAS